jgi:hypothetical protein
LRIFPSARRLSASEVSAFRLGIGVLDIPSDDEDLRCVEYRAVLYELAGFARDRSSELIYEWDSIHLDGASWLSPGCKSSNWSADFELGDIVKGLRQSST